jgi:hypothetical protein
VIGLLLACFAHGREDTENWSEDAYEMCSRLQYSYWNTCTPYGGTHCLLVKCFDQYGDDGEECSYGKAFAYATREALDLVADDCEGGWTEYQPPKSCATNTGSPSSWELAIACGPSVE